MNDDIAQQERDAQDESRRRYNGGYDLGYADGVKATFAELIKLAETHEANEYTLLYEYEAGPDDRIEDHPGNHPLMATDEWGNFSIGGNVVRWLRQLQAERNQR